VEVPAKSPPPHVKIPGMYPTPGGEGIESYALYEVEKGHIDEGNKST